MCWEKIKAFFTKSSAATVETAPEEGTASVDMAAWTFASPLAYFKDGDEVTVLTRAQEFALLGEEDRASVAAAVEGAVIAAVAAMAAEGDEAGIRRLGVDVADALFAGAVRLYDARVRADAVAPYLQATAKPLFTWLQDHGICVAYCSNCAFETMDAIWHEFPDYFAAAGLVYICAQNTARQMLEHNGAGEAKYDAEREKYLSSAFFVVRRMQQECASKRRSYVCLDAEGDSRTYRPTMDLRGQAGLVVAERSGALRNVAHQSFAVYNPEPQAEVQAEVQAEAAPEA